MQTTHDGALPLNLEFKKMHTCSPPTDALDEWLTAYPSIVGNYGHLLLEQACDCDDDLIGKLVPYFESAHADARRHFHEQMGMDLHPDSSVDPLAAHAAYPNCLPPITRRGLFGEVMAGMITENYDLIGSHDWHIPVFLFRYHEDAEQYLFTLARDPDRKREIYGRRGSDFLALALDEEGKVKRFIAGEAKWRKLLQPAVVNELMHGKNSTNKKTGVSKNDGRGIWNLLNRDTKVPHGLRQLQRLLRMIDPDGHSAAILSLDQVLTLREPQSLPRTNLILIAGNDVPSRKAQVSLIPWEVIPIHYTAPHDLQVVEIILNDGDTLIDGLYDAVWVRP